MMEFIPNPHKIEHPAGVHMLDNQSRITLWQTEPAALLYAQMLQGCLREYAGLEVPFTRGKPRAGDAVLTVDTALPQNRYTLSIMPECITLKAGSDEALCNGVQTLCQYIEQHGAVLPALEIEDWPDLANRGYYQDCSRGRVPKLDYLKQVADILCRYKINQWQLYIEHTYLFRDLSEAWREDTPLTAQEIMELDDYCAARHIELVPSLSTFGHMYRILSTKTCCDLCELPDSEKIPFSYTYAGNHHTLNVSNPDALGFVKGLIDEYRPLFRSSKFNICDDETFDLGKGRSKALAEEQSERSLYLSHVKALCEYLVAQGVTPQFWGDIMWRFPESCAELPKETICLNWGYLPHQRENEIRDIAASGITQYACPGVDQLPGTCMEFYMSDDGAARLSPEGSVLIAARDVPMFYTGEMQHHPIRLCDGAAENNARPLYSWVMNNNWETNFKMDLSGFCQYDYSLWLTNISDPEQAMDELHEQLFDPYVLIVR